MVHKVIHLYLRNCQLAFIYVLCYMEEISIKTIKIQLSNWQSYATIAVI